MNARLYLIGLLLGTLAITSPVAAATTSEGIVLRVPADPVPWRGVVTESGTASGASVLYPAPSPEAFLAALITHGIFNESSRRSREHALQAEADKVLEPYASIVASMRQVNLAKEAGTRLGASVAATGQAITTTGLILDYAPTYFLTPDQRAVVLAVSVSVRRTPNATEPTYANVVRAVSQPLAAADPQAWWLADNGAHMHSEAASLLQSALAAVVTDMQGDPWRDIAERTVRYREGGNERVERAKFIPTGCNRATLRTLRGELMLVPLSTRTNGEQTSPCE